MSPRSFVPASHRKSRPIQENRLSLTRAGTCNRTYGWSGKPTHPGFQDLYAPHLIRRCRASRLALRLPDRSEIEADRSIGTGLEIASGPGLMAVKTRCAR